MNEVELPEGEALEKLRRNYVTIANEQALLRSTSARSGPRAIAASRLYAYAAGRLPYPDAEIEDRLADNPTMRAAYRGMAESLAVDRLTAVAASDDPIPDRSGQEFSLRVQQASGDRDQYYIIIELAGAAGAAPTVLKLFDSDDLCMPFELPEAHKNVIQFIADAQSDLIRLLRDPDVEVLLG